MNLKDSIFFALGAGWSGLPAASILMYHSIEDKSGHFNSVSPREFSRQMAYLAEHRYDVISLSELVRRLHARENIARTVVITFDDGYRNNFTEAFPILKQYRFPGMIFLVTDRIGETDEKSGLEYLQENELKEMDVSGLIDVEPHTATHPKLGTLPAHAAREEMVRSKEAIDRILGKRARYLAYPFGNYTEETTRIALACGFEAALTVREALVRPGARLLELPRVSIDSSTTFRQFKGKVSNALDRYERLKRLFKGV